MLHPSRVIPPLALFLIGLGALWACASPTPTPTPTPTLTVAPTPTPTPSPTPPSSSPADNLPPLTLPADEAPHSFLVEWWYFNAQLSTQEGERFTLHDVIFQVQQPDSGFSLYTRQIGLGGGEHGFATDEDVLFQPAPFEAAPGDFDIALGESRMAGTGGEQYALRAAVGGYEYDLTLRSTAPPLLHGNDGLVDFGSAGVSYYYTRPRLEITGTLISPDGERAAVTGLGWLDKQWGDFQPTIVEWDWTSVQLNDGTDLMISVLRTLDGVIVHRYATLRRPGEEQRTLRSEEFRFSSSGEVWRSSVTGTAYPIEWLAEVPGEGLTLRIRPLTKESEFTSDALGVTYWESGMEVTDADGRVIGQGFVELNRRPGNGS